MLLLPRWSCVVWASASSPPIGECQWALQTPCVGPPPFDDPGEGEDRGNRRHSSTHAAELYCTRWVGTQEIKRKRKTDKWKKCKNLLYPLTYRIRCEERKRNRSKATKRHLNDPLKVLTTSDPKFQIPVSRLASLHHQKHVEQVNRELWIVNYIIIFIIFIQIQHSEIQIFVSVQVSLFPVVIPK